MGRCLKCERKGLFLKVNEAGLCKECALEEEQQKAAEHEAALAEAREFVSGLSAAFADIVESGGHFPASSYTSWLDTKDVPIGCVGRLRDDCNYICSEFPRWVEYPLFEEALLEKCVPHPRIGGRYEHPYIDLGILEKGSPGSNDLERKISDKLERVRRLDTALMLYGEYEYTTCRIVGVTFQNENSRKRQEILKDIRYKKAPYRANPDIRLVKYDYNGEDAVAVYANEEQIGHISNLDLSMFVLPRWERYIDVCEFSIHGTGSRDNKFGMDIEIRFRKKES